MSIFGGAKKSAAVTPSYTGLQVQTATNALPIPIVWGTNKIAPNLIWYNDFITTPQTTKASGKGGSTKTVSGYSYSAAVIMSLCEGPITGVGEVWNGQSTTDTGTLALSLFNGATPQAVWSYLTTAHPDQALAYQGTAYLAASGYDLGSSASIDNNNFEVQGVLAGSSALGFDADPALAISDFLTNAQYGVGFPGASIAATTLFGTGGDTSYQTYCRAVGLALSPALTDQEAANSILSRWLQLTNTAAVWSGGQLKLVPYGDAAVTGNGYTWQPNLTPVYNLTDDDFKGDGSDDPVKAARADPYACANVQSVEILDRANSYNAAPIQARDQAAIEAFGLRVGSTITAHEICNANVGAIAVQLILQRGLYIRTHYAFKLSWEYCLLEPMDLITLTDPGLGLAGTPVRIVEIEEDEGGLLSVTAEEFPAGTATAVLYPVQHSNGTRINREVAASAVNAPIIFEPPSTLTSGVPQVWIAASGGSGNVVDPNWGGCNVWLSLDGATYEQVGQVTSPARQGFTTAALPAFAGTNPDTADTLAVDLRESAGTLASTGATAAANGATLCLIGNELVTFTAATLTGPHRYGLTGLYRGLYGTAPAAQPSAARFARLDEAVFEYALPAGYVGRPLYVKLQSFNVFGGGVQSLAACTAYSYTPTGLGFLGSILTPLSNGRSVNLGLITEGVTLRENLGLITDPVSATVQLGTVP